jgi:localization factor PodJL
MTEATFDAIAERIARLGRREADTAMASPAPSQQVERLTRLLDETVGSFGAALEKSEARAVEAITRSEGKAARALEAVGGWIERAERRDAALDRTLEGLARRLEDIDERLMQQPEATAANVRQTMQAIEQRLERIGRAAQADAAQPPGLAEALRDLDRRMQSIARQLADPAAQRAADGARDASIGRLETQLAEILSTVKRGADDDERRRSEPDPRRGLFDGDLAATIHEIAERQRTLDVETEKRIEPMMRELRDETHASIRTLRTDLEALIGRIAPPGEGRAAQAEIGREIKALTLALGDLAPRRQVQRIEAAMRDLAARIDASRSEGVRESLLAPIERMLGEIRATLKEPRGLADVGRQIEALRGRIEALSAGADPRAIGALQADMAEIRATLGRDDGARTLQAIERRMMEISDRLDEIAARPQSSRGDEAIEAAIRDIRALLDRPDPSPGIEARLSEQLALQTRAIEAKLEAARPRPGGADASPELAAMVDILAERLSGIHAMLEEAPRSPEVERLSRQVAQIEGKLDRLPSQSAAGDVAGMVRQLAGKLDAIERALPDAAALSETIRRLSDTVDRGGIDQAALARIDGQFARVHERIDEVAANNGQSPAMERAIADIFSQLDALRSNGATVAAAAARASVEETLKSIGPDALMGAAGEGVAALGRDLAALKAQQDQSDRRNFETLTTVNETLEKIVDRLSMLEADILEARTRSAGEHIREFAQGAALGQARAEPGRFSRAAAPQERFSPGDPFDDEPFAPRAQEPLPAVETPPIAPRRETAEFSSAPLRGAPPEPAAEPQPQKATSLVMSMRQMLSRGMDARIEEEPTPALAASRMEPSFADPAPAAPLEAAGDPMRADTLAAPQDDDLDVPLEPGTTTPREGLGSGRPAAATAELPEPEARSPRSEFLKLARQAMSAGETPPEPKAGRGKAAKAAAQAPRTERVSVMELDGAGKAVSARKVVPLIGVAAVVAAAGLGGAMLYGGDFFGTRNDETPARPAPVEGGAPTEAAPQEAPPAPQSSVPPPRRVDEAAAPADPAFGADPMATASVPEAPAAAPVAPARALPPVTAGGVAIAKLRELAELGDAPAQYEMALRSLEGRGLERDPAEAARWLEKAARAGLAPAQYRLGAMYREGSGVKADSRKALDLFRKAAEKGNAKAMHNYAVVLSEGTGGAPDYPGAARWFLQAAEHGIRDSQYNIAILYARGLGVPQDLSASYRWFDAAARQGDKDAGVKRDEIGAKLDPAKRAIAREAAEAFRPRTLDPVSNDVVLPTAAAAQG